MRYILLLLLLLLPSKAVSQTKYDLSCENVANIRIMHIKDTPWDAKSESGHFYVVRIDLKPSATELFGRLVKDASTIFIDKNGVGHAERELSFTANGALLITDTPYLTGFDKYGVTLGTSREQEAVDTAWSVCPALTPQREVLVHEYHTGLSKGALPSTGAAELAFNISCDNVQNIGITKSANPFLQRYAADGIVHGVLFFLKPEAQVGFQAFVAASREKLAAANTTALPPFTPISVTANGNPLRNDLLEIRAYGGTKICTFIFREEDARVTARSVCPTAPIELIIVPTGMTTYGPGIVK
ncbi:MAG: hypothetical protein Q7I92_05540 [Humidesulfovibrio sp.]|nr:hypothetical protein [Humidesulfovibrio sp.]